ncbi:MAG: hypothetical protein JKY90_09450 [Gammaproteobacteria bacterium]|nr:hypothetical protein [Gammaproteobacteria bacterium]
MRKFTFPDIKGFLPDFKAIAKSIKNTAKWVLFKEPIKMKVRPHPVGTKIITETKDKAVFTIRAMHATHLALVIMASSTLFWFGALGAIGGAMELSYDAYGNPIMPEAGGSNMFRNILLIAFLAWIVWRIGFPRVKFIVTQSSIQIGSRLFERSLAGLVVAGYTTTTPEIEKGTSMSFIVPRLQYGQWGENLPYMFNPFMATEYIIWANQMIDSVGVSKEKTTKDGHRKQAF